MNKHVCHLLLLLLLTLLLTACQTTANNQQPAANSQQPTANNQQPTTSSPQPTASDQPAATSDQPPAASPQLPFDQFLNDSYLQLLRRDPELITELGLDTPLGMPGDQLTPISDSYLRETQALEAATLTQLRAYDRASLTPEQQLSYDVYEWYLDDLVRGHEFTYYDYPVTFFLTSVHLDLQQFFTDLHPITSQQDAQNYITRLGQLQTKFDDLLAGLQTREAMGVIPPKFAIQWALPDIRAIAQSSPRSTPFYTALEQKLQAVSSIDPAGQDTLLAAAEQTITSGVIPAYQALYDYMTHLESIATDDDGVWKLPNGDAYYAYTLRHHTTTDLTAAEIHQLGLDELERIHAEMRQIFDQLGYPQDETLPQLFNRVASDSGFLSGNDIMTAYEAIIADAEARVSAAFDLRPKAEVIVIPDPYGGYYIEPAMDGSRPGAFYATASGTEARFGMPTLAYHEAVPGHHFQLAIIQELTNLPAVRQGVRFTANTEGWALYAERLAAELGFYDGDPYGDLGRLQAEAFRAARLVVDTGLHAQGWTFQQAADFMEANTGQPRRMVEGQIARYIVWPGQATAYKIGMNAILTDRQAAMDRLGDQFDLKEFHNIILKSGSLPLPIMDRVIQEAVAAQLSH